MYLALSTYVCLSSIGDMVKTLPFQLFVVSVTSLRS